MPRAKKAHRDLPNGQELTRDQQEVVRLRDEEGLTYRAIQRQMRGFDGNGSWAYTTYMRAKYLLSKK